MSKKRVIVLIFLLVLFTIFLTLGSSTYQDWNWNFVDNCNLNDKIYNVENYNITSYNSGTWALDNITIIATDFDMNNTKSWNIIVTITKIIGI